MISAIVPSQRQPMLTRPRTFARPKGLRLLLCRAFNALLASAIAVTVFCAAYLCKCKMGIDLFAGPSFLHEPLFWLVSASA